MTRTCPGCGRRFTGPRNKKTCSDKCRKQKSREGLKSWAEVEAEIQAMGVEAARSRAKASDDFRDHLITALGQYEDTHPPTGPVAVPGDLGGVVPDLLAGGFHIGEERLPSSADIDAAEASGDWSDMVGEALDGMMWQFAHGYRPDLREFDPPPAMAELLAKSDKWQRSMNEQARPARDDDGWPTSDEAALYPSKITNR